MDKRLLSKKTIIKTMIKELRTDLLMLLLLIVIYIMDKDKLPFISAVIFSAIAVILLKVIIIIFIVGIGKFTIHTDALVNSRIVVKRNGRRDILEYCCCFKRYDKEVKTDIDTFQNGTRGDKFYLVVLCRKVYLYNARDYKLDEKLNNKLSV